MAEPALELGGARVGPYLFEQFIDRGGMGEVWRAWDERLERPVAIKIPRAEYARNPESRRRFLKEGRRASRVTHPYVVSVYDVVESDGTVYIVMEYIDGKPLDKAFAEGSAASRQPGRVALEVAEALEAIHGAGLVHRDLKPGNILLTETGHVKVTDFGLSVRTSNLEPVRSAASTVSIDDLRIAGTMLYMSPEQLCNRPLDPRSDIFSFGVTMFDVLAGEHPFKRASATETLSAILERPPGKDGRLPPSFTQTGPLATVVLRCLEKEPGQRYESATALVEDLRRIERGESVARRGRDYRLPARWRGVAAFAATAALGGALLQVAAVHSRSTQALTVGPSMQEVVVVLPLESATGQVTIGGSALANLIRESLGQDRAFSVVSAARTEALIGADITPRLGEHPSAPLRQALRAAAGRYLVSGTWKRRSGRIHAKLDLHDLKDSRRSRALFADGESLTAVAGVLGPGIHEWLGAVAPSLSEPGPLPVGSDSAILDAERGRKAGERGRLAEAAGYYSRATAAQPAFVRAHLERAEILLASGWVTRAHEAIDLAIKESERLTNPLPQRLRVEIERLEARVVEDRAGEQRAAARLVEAFPDDAEAHVLAALSWRRANLNEEALAAIQAALARAPGEPSFLLQKAGILLKLNRLDEAEKVLLAAKTIDDRLAGSPIAPRIWLVHGELAIRRQRYEEARDHYARAAEAFAARGEPLRLGATEEAIAESHLLQGAIAAALPTLERAVQDFAEAGDLRREAKARNTLGACYLQMGSLSLAERELRTAISQMRATGGDRPNASAFLNLASVLVRRGDAEAAIAMAREAGDLARDQGDDEREAKAFALRGWAQTELARFDDAEESYRKSLELIAGDPSDELHGTIWLGRARMTGLRGAWTEAVEAADRGVETHRAGERWLALGYAHEERAQWRRALGDSTGADDDLREAQSRADAAGLAHDLAARCAVARGRAALDDERWGEAAAEAGLALARLDPGSGLAVRARATLGLALCGSGQAQEGLGHARAAVADAHGVVDRVQAGLDLAWCLRRADDPETARPEAQSALDQSESARLPWETARAAAALLSLPTESQPAGAESVRARGRRALESLIRGNPEASRAPMLRRPIFQETRQAIGPSILETGTRARGGN